MPPRSPAVGQFELTHRLRERRNALGLPIREISRHLDFTPNYYSAVENGRTLLAPDKLDLLCQRLEFTAEETAELQALRDLAREHRWTSDFSPVLSPELALFYGLEYGAAKVRSYEGSVIPGMLQTDAYALALIRDDPETPGVKAQRRLELRHRRRQRLYGDDPLHFSVLISESVVTQQIGGPAVLEEQIHQLVDYAEQIPTLDLRVVPFSASPRGMVNASTIHLLEFATPHLPVLGWREAITAIGITDDRDLVDLLEVNFLRATESALTGEDTLTLLRARARELQGHSH